MTLHDLRTTPTIADEIQKQLLDTLTRDHTAFPTFQALLDAEGGYFPSIKQMPSNFDECDKGMIFTPCNHSSRQVRCDNYYKELDTLAIAYDQAQEARGASRRAFRS